MYPVIVTEGNNTGRHVRCYCNLPSCVTTGYMCKSPLGCFSELSTDVNRASHGCIEALENREQKAKCMNSPSESPVRNTAGIIGGIGQTASAFVLCCYKDVCNHVDSPTSRHRFNDSIIAGGNWSGFPNTAGTNAIGAPGASESNNNEVWFKAATIAVPICGALILFLLIALAVKLLRSDALDTANKLSATYISHGSGHGALDTPLMKKVSPQRECVGGIQPAASAPLLMSHANVVNICEVSKSNVAFKKSGELGCDCNGSCGVMHHHQMSSQQSSPLSKPSNTTNKRDVNVNVVSANPGANSDVCTNGKLYEKQLLPLNDKLYNKETIIYWGQANANHCPR